MKRVATLIVAFICFSVSSYAQYHFNVYNPAGQNPGNLNNNPEQPLGNTPGYTTVMAASAAAPALAWSANQTIPFTFSFNGGLVSQYKVSNSGVLTFTTSATSVPSTTNASLPSNSIPNNSVCVWGISQGGGNDAIGSVTFGTAPFRQHWIEFLSFTTPTGAINPANGNWVYWGIVLEETTNRIYVVDKRTFNVANSLTIGVQINSTTAYQIATAPNTPSFVTNGGNASDATDNVYYEFVPGNRPSYDLSLESLDEQNKASIGTNLIVSGDLRNRGVATLDSIYIHWTANGGIVNTELITGFTLTTQDTMSFAHSLPWAPTNPGNFSTIKVWTDLPTGKVDANTFNDTLSYDVFVGSGMSVTKNVLLEEFTTAPCQFCPDGAVVVEQILNSNPNVIGVAEHACFGTDAMTIPEASIYCTAFGSGAPTASIDRVLFPGESNVAHSRVNWIANANSQSMLTAPVDVFLTGIYNSTNRIVSARINANFVDYVVGGDLRVTLFVVEDHVVGSGNGYNQVNAYNTQAGHTYFGAGNPIVGYDHRHVLRDVYPSSNAWGDNSVIPTNPVINTNYSKNFTFSINNAWKDTSVSLVAFVSYYNTNVGQREVLNAFEVKLNNLVTSVNEIKNTKNDLKVYPNPSSGSTNIDFDLEKSEQVDLIIRDITGKEVLHKSYGQLAAGQQKLKLESEFLHNGIYFMNVTIGNKVITRKISFLR